MPFTLGMLLYTVGRIFTVVSITPGGVGVVEIAYSAVYLSALGDVRTTPSSPACCSTGH